MRIFQELETDILIVGGGVSGLAAAWAAGNQKKITLLMDGSGASPFIHGFSLPVGEGDSSELFEEDTLKSGRFQNDPVLVHKLAVGCSSVPTVLEQLGISLDRNVDGSFALLRPLGASVPRVVSAGNHTGAVLRKKLLQQLKQRRNVNIYCNTRALRLLTNASGVSGALLYDRRKHHFSLIKVNTIILACGGFCGIFPFSTNTSDIGGDGIAMAYMAGAALRDMEFVQFEPCVGLFPSAVRGKGMITTMFYEGACLRDRFGKRFMENLPSKEQVDKDILAENIFQQIQAGNGTQNGGVWFDATAVPISCLKEAYPAYVERYAACEIDLSATPVEVAPAPHTSLGGVAIEADGSTTLPGLFACGEVTGGVHGANRLGGNAGLETLVFGLETGIRASQTTRSHQYTLLEDFSLPLLSQQIRLDFRSRMQGELAKNLGVIRNETGLRHSMTVLQDLLAHCTSAEDGEPSDYFETIRLNNDLQTAFLMTRAALARKNSCGCHIRQDY